MLNMLKRTLRTLDLSREKVKKVKLFCDEARTDDMASGPRKGASIVIQYIPGILADAVAKQKNVETVYRDHADKMDGRYEALFSDKFAKFTKEKVEGGK